MWSKQPQEKAGKNREKFKKIKVEIFFTPWKDPEVIYLQNILNFNLFYCKHIQVKKKEIPKNNDIFTPNIKINYHKTMKHISQSIS